MWCVARLHISTVIILFANDTDSFIHDNDLYKLIGELQAELTKAIKLLNLF